MVRQDFINGVIKKKNVPVKTHEKCLATIFLKLRKTRQTLYQQFPRDTATMLEKIKSENFLGSQILYLHVPFSTWKNTSAQ